MRRVTTTASSTAEVHTREQGAGRVRTLLGWPHEAAQLSEPGRALLCSRLCQVAASGTGVSV